MWRLSIIVFILFSCLASKPELTYNSNPELVTKDHFDNCILASNYEQLIDLNHSNEKVLFEYFPSTLNSTGCEGIYFYRYISPSHKQPIYRGMDGLRYNKFFIFAIHEGNIIPISLKSKKYRSKFIKSKLRLLINQDSIDETIKLKQQILDGYVDVY